MNKMKYTSYETELIKKYFTDSQFEIYEDANNSPDELIRYHLPILIRDALDNYASSIGSTSDNILPIAIMYFLSNNPLSDGMLRSPILNKIEASTARDKCSDEYITMDECMKLLHCPRYLAQELCGKAYAIRTLAPDCIRINKRLLFDYIEATDLSNVELGGMANDRNKADEN